MSEWPILRSDGGDFGMSMHSRGFVRSPRCAACSVIRKRASSPSNGAQKNDLQLLWSSALGLVRPTHTARSRSVVWRRAHLSGDRGASGAVQELRAREARAARLPGGQSRLLIDAMSEPIGARCDSRTTSADPRLNILQRKKRGRQGKAPSRCTHFRVSGDRCGDAVGFSLSTRRRCNGRRRAERAGVTPRIARSDWSLRRWRSAPVRFSRSHEKARSSLHATC